MSSQRNTSPVYDSAKAETAALKASEAASQVLRGRFRPAGDMALETWMKSPGALVTDADIASDKAIARALLDSDLPISILSEESISEITKTGSCWLVDPLCGTVPFSMGMVHWGVNIALLVDGQLDLGVITIPATGEQLVGVRGSGVQLNGQPWKGIAPSRELAGATVGVEADGGAEWNRVLSDGMAWVSRVGHVNTFASAAYPAAQVCMGRMAAAVFYKIAPVHIAAGACIAMEMGLPVTDGQGQPLEWTSEEDLPLVIMGWPEVHSQLIEAIRSPSG